ncbi:MAG: NB-ARC domain-containing protein [Bacteroidota bacterium]
MIKPIRKIFERAELSKSDSDTAYFLDLMYTGEQMTKLVASGLVSCITDDSKRHRYSQIYRLVRADGIGEWTTVIEEVLTGPASQYFNPVVNGMQRQLTERLSKGSWQYDATESIYNCVKRLDSTIENLPTKGAGKTWFSYFATLRNKTRGHGAISADLYADLCLELENAVTLFINNYYLFTDVQWAYLYRSLSGKYRVSDISDNATSFHYLKTDRNQNFENGVHIFLNKPTKVELVYSNSELNDFFFPNGGFTNKKYEILSYISGSKDYEDATAYLIPPGDLPSSETEGIGKLDLLGNVFTNLPTTQQSYIKRHQLEEELKKVLLDDRHPIVTLTGRGGIGKTSLAISVLKDLCNDNRFSSIIWFSARDIDLLTEGAKPVKPHVLSEDDIAKEYLRLVEPEEAKEKGFKPKPFIEKELGKSSIGPTLFIFDNFETVKNPIDLFQWLDTFIRTPNKILITSRFREFKADYPIEVSGMNEAEFHQLVELTSNTLGIGDLINSAEYLDELYNESDGHPYVIKVLLGEVAKEGKLGKIKRIVAGKDEILIALFERTFNGLSPAAKRVFLTLANWRSTIPQLAIEAVLMREANETMDVEKAIEELHRSSLIEINKSDKDGMLFISVPLSASVFGKKKLTVSPMKSAIEADTRLLHTFGVGLNTEIHLGVEPRIIKFFRDIAKRVSLGKDDLDNYISILEFICRKYPYAWLTLSSLYEEENKIDKAIESLQSYLEFTEDEYQKLTNWQRLAVLYSKQNDWNGEIHSLTEICELNISPIELINLSIDRINAILSTHKFSSESEKEIMVRRVISSFNIKLSAITPKASDYSQLAWLNLYVNDKSEAIKALKSGLKIDSENYHCLKLKKTLHV